MKLISMIEDREVIRKILTHLNLPSELPVPAPARAPPQTGQQEIDFFPDEDPGFSPDD